MKLTNKDILGIAAALKQLDGDKNGPYKLSSAVRLAIAKKQRRFNELAEDIDTVRLGLVKERGLGKLTKDEDGKDVSLDSVDDLEAFQVDWTAFLRVEQELEVGLFTIADLNLDTNDIVASVIAALLPIAKD